MNNCPLVLGYGWHDLETDKIKNTGFRWTHLKSSIEVVDNSFDHVMLIFKNSIINRTIKFYVKQSNSIKKLIYELKCGIDETYKIRIPISNVTEIIIECDLYYCPYEAMVSDDKRKLCLTMYEFHFEKNSTVYNFRIQDVLNKKELSDFKISDEVVLNTNEYSYYKKINDINISDKLSHGILLYLPNISEKYEKTFESLKEFKISKNDLKIVVYTDGIIDYPYSHPFEFIQLDKFPIMYDSVLPSHYKYANYSFFEAIKIAMYKNWDYFFYYEWDCMVGQDYWYDTLWEEHLSWDNRPIATGTPVLKHNTRCVGNFLQGSLDYRYNYSKECKLYMCVENSSEFALYTNGALSFFDTKELYRIFQNEMNVHRFSMSDYMDINMITAWDLELGIRLYNEIREKSFEKVKWLASSYSGCGDSFYNQTQRLNMLKSGLKIAIHQYKY